MKQAFRIKTSCILLNIFNILCLFFFPKMRLSLTLALITQPPNCRDYWHKPLHATCMHLSWIFKCQIAKCHVTESQGPEHDSESLGGEHLGKARDNIHDPTFSSLRWSLFCDYYTRTILTVHGVNSDSNFLGNDKMPLYKELSQHTIQKRYTPQQPPGEGQTNLRGSSLKIQQ